MAMLRRLGPQTTAHRPKNKQRRKTCFFDLPGELRNRIYRLALIKKSELYLTLKEKKRVPADTCCKEYSIVSLKPGGGIPCMLYASQRLNSECRRIFFEENYFTFHDTTLTFEAINAFRNILNRSLPNIWRLGVHRRFFIGDLKTPFEVHFVAVIEQPDKSKPERRILLCRPQNENRPFPGIKSKMRGTFAEPCRCQVKRLAWSCHHGKKTNGHDLFDFIEAYLGLIRKTAESESIEICPKCDSVKRK